MTATCQSCQVADAYPRTGLFHRGCPECEARSLADSMAYAESAKAGTLTDDYRRALHVLFGVGWKEAHERVKHWAARIKATPIDPTLAGWEAGVP